jgi:hypothetical protein
MYVYVGPDEKHLVPATVNDPSQPMEIENENFVGRVMVRVKDYGAKGAKQSEVGMGIERVGLQMYRGTHGARLGDSSGPETSDRKRIEHGHPIGSLGLTLSLLRPENHKILTFNIPHMLSIRRQPQILTPHDPVLFQTEPPTQIRSPRPRPLQTRHPGQRTPFWRSL